MRFGFSTSHTSTLGPGSFVIDAFARRIVGWKVSTSATAGFELDALEQAIHARWPGPNDFLAKVHIDGVATSGGIRPLFGHELHPAPGGIQPCSVGRQRRQLL
jgi:hypothetical protein